MKLELLTIGSELLSGFTINSNAAAIGQLLSSQGFPINRVICLPDAAFSIKRGIIEAMERSSFVIITGGLGPTKDDLTRGVIADIFNVPLIYSQTVADDLIRRFTVKLSTLRDQSMVPQGAQILYNPIGTAPGVILSHQKSSVIMLPGVPVQMEAMLPAVIHYLKEHATPSYFVKSLYFCHLDEEQVDPLLRQLEREYVDVHINICPSYGVLSIFIYSCDPQYFDPIVEAIIQSFSTYFFSTTCQKIEYAIHEWMVMHNKTLACAESCTGGRLSSRLVAICGASSYFLGGIVSYSNAFKRSALHISSTALCSHGAVSEEVVTEMARSTLKISEADYAIAISGIAGPYGGSDNKPVGTVWGAIATKEQIFVGKFLAKGVPHRESVIDYSVTFLLGTLWRYLQHNVIPFV